MRCTAKADRMLLLLLLLLLLLVLLLVLLSFMPLCNSSWEPRRSLREEKSDKGKGEGQK